MNEYVLKHQDDSCALMKINKDTGTLEDVKIIEKELMPFLGNADKRMMSKWWEMRTVPASRKMMQDVIRKAGCENNGLYLAKNLALSMTDSYWICPIDTGLKWKDVNLRRILGTNQKVPYHNATSFDPNASLGGQMEKYWNMEQDIPYLVKISHGEYGQQAVNEAFATFLHERQNTSVPFVRYSAMPSDTEENKTISKCMAFTSNDIEFISAYEILTGVKTKSDMSLYDAYIEICARYGVNREIMQTFMDYQTLTDFLISNTDEHLNNFGVLRDAKTLKLISPAPIFDSGNSMFYNSDRRTPYSRYDLITRKITSFHDTEERMLKHIKNKNCVNISKLPSNQEVIEFYTNAGIPLDKAEFIAANYNTKKQLTLELQQGKKISAYVEKQKMVKRISQEAETANLGNYTNEPKYFLLMSGIPGSGKTINAYRYIKECESHGMKKIDSSKFYSVNDAYSEAKFFYRKEALIEKAVKKNQGLFQGKNCFVYISANDIRNEMKRNRMMPDNDIVFIIADARMESALANGCSVIYDASNLKSRVRKGYVNIAKKYGVLNKKVIINDLDPEKAYSICAERGTYIQEEQIRQMYQMLHDEFPSKEEGWDEIEIQDFDYMHQASCDKEGELREVQRLMTYENQSFVSSDISNTSEIDFAEDIER